MEYRSKFLKLLSSRAKKYTGYNKTIVERKIDNILNKKLMAEAVSSVTSRLEGIPYAIVGGHAVTIHGHPRTTDDVDILTLPKYVDEIVERLGLQVSSSLTIGGVAASTPAGTEIDVISPDWPWLQDAISEAENTKYGQVISKPYLVLMKLVASRGIQDDSDAIKMLQAMDESEQEKAVELVNKFLPSMADDVQQMLELAKIGFDL